jgi:hypothetical protein
MYIYIKYHIYICIYIGDVLQKLSQLVSDLSNRNFAGASALQTVSIILM